MRCDETRYDATCYDMMQHGTRHTTHDTRHMTHDTRHMTHDTRYMTYDARRMKRVYTANANSVVFFAITEAKPQLKRQRVGALGSVLDIARANADEATPKEEAKSTTAVSAQGALSQVTEEGSTDLKGRVPSADLKHAAPL